MVVLLVTRNLILPLIITTSILVSYEKQMKKIAKKTGKERRNLEHCFARALWSPTADENRPPSVANLRRTVTVGPCTAGA